MDDREIRIAIAKERGFHGEPFMVWDEHGSHLRMMKGALDFPVPDYPNDLNAMHEVEEELFDAEKYEYLEELERLVSPIRRDFCVFATAAQRAEAFWRIINRRKKSSAS